jgi:hypothetical protein
MSTEKIEARVSIKSAKLLVKAGFVIFCLSNMLKKPQIRTAPTKQDPNGNRVGVNA